MEKKKTKRKFYVNFWLILIFTIIFYVILIITINNIKFKTTIICKDEIVTENIYNFNEITLTTNNIHSLFDIEINSYKKQSNEKGTFVFSIKPLLENYNYISCSLTFKVKVNETYSGYEKFETVTCLLDINGECYKTQEFKTLSNIELFYTTENVTGKMKIKNT